MEFFDEEPIKTISLPITKNQTIRLNQYIQTIIGFVGAKGLRYTILSNQSDLCPLTLHVSKYPINSETLIKSYLAKNLFEFKQLVIKKYNKL